MLGEKGVLKDATKHVAASNVVSNLELPRSEIPLFLPVKRRKVDTARNVDAIGYFRYFPKWTLNSVVDCLHETRPKFDGQRLAGANDRIANRDASWKTLALVHARGSTQPNPSLRKLESLLCRRQSG